jgi:NAD(P)-dependent dehydrogenase (short-subunit alcohol dehydrogenase family)
MSIRPQHDRVMPFAERVAIVTGGGGGIGRAVCAAFLDAGARVMIADVDEPSGERVAAELESGRRTIAFAHTDTSEEESVGAMVENTMRLFGRVDVLVNAAAEFIMRGIDASVSEWRRVMDVNIMGYALCAREVVPHMIAGGAGAIVNVGSVSGFIAQPEYLTYNATKGAVAAMTRCMALDLARHNIRVNAVCPGTVWTERTARYVEDTLGLSRPDADRHPEVGGVHMLQRTADPEEIASVILFLASDGASFMTGENVMVDGGYSAR